MLVKRPEISVKVERHTLELDGSTPRGRIARLVAAGFYDQGATNSATRSELKRTGSDVNNANICRVLDELVSQGFLTREGSDYKRVPSAKVTVKE